MWSFKKSDVLISKKEFFIHENREETYFTEGEEFLILSKDKKNSVIKHRIGGIIFNYPTKDVEKIFKTVNL